MAEENVPPAPPSDQDQVMAWPRLSVALAPSVVVPPETTVAGLAEAATASVCVEAAGFTFICRLALPSVHGAHHLQIAVAVRV